MKRYGMVFLAALLLLSCTAAAAEPARYDLLTEDPGEPAPGVSTPAPVMDVPVDEDTYREEPATPYTPPVRQAGRGEVDDILQYWEDNGYPEDVSYAFEAGGEVVSGPEGDAVYSWWEIGLVDADEARQQEILDLVSPTCLVEFRSCRYPHSQKLAAYEAVAPLAEEDEHILDVIFVRNSDFIVVAVADGYGKEYAQALVGQYGAVVSIQEGTAVDDYLTAPVLTGENGPALPGMGLDRGNALLPGWPGKEALVFGGAYAPWLIALAAAALGGLAVVAFRRRPVPVRGRGNGSPAGTLTRRQAEEAVRQGAEGPDPAIFRQILQKIDDPQP